MSVSPQPSRIERLLDRARPSRRVKAAQAEAEGLKHLTDLLYPTEPARAGRQPYDTGRTA